MGQDFHLDGKEWFETLYDNREKWVPVFVQDQFWVGMSSIQRSESMNAYFDGYVHKKTSLQTFVEQFEIALGDKIEKEIKEDAACLIGKLKCQTTFAMEVQFQEAYTHNLFKKVQDELSVIMYCDADLVNDDDPIVEFKVTERKDYPNGMTRETWYTVVYNTSNGDVNCICRMFN